MSEKNLAGEKQVTEITTETTPESSSTDETLVDETSPQTDDTEGGTPSASSSEEATPAQNPIEETPHEATETSQEEPISVEASIDATSANETSTEDSSPTGEILSSSTDEASPTGETVPESASAKTDSEDGSETATKPKKKKRRRRKKNTSNDQETILNLKKGQHLVGKIKNITEFGAFVDLGIAQDGLVHISQMARQKVEKPTDVVEEGQEVQVWVKKVDKKRGRISLTMVRPVALKLRDIKPEAELEGVVTRLEAYGAFIDIASERDGLVHISEITHEYINHPEEVLAIDAKVNIKVLKVDHKKRQVDLSIKALLPPPPPKEEPKPVIRERTERPKQKNRNKKKKVEKQIKISDFPMITTMEAAFSVFQDENSSTTTDDNQSKEPAKQQDELAAIISRTLTTETK
jgi:predicted RNA-binding protein with RPS1 domain